MRTPRSIKRALECEFKVTAVDVYSDNKTVRVSMYNNAFERRPNYFNGNMVFFDITIKNLLKQYPSIAKQFGITAEISEQEY